MHTDNKGEYITSELQLFLRKQEIIYKTSTLYIHQQNGHTEWLNYTLLEKMQLIQLKVYLLDFW